MSPPSCWPPPDDTPIGEVCARQLVVWLKTVTLPAIAFCEQLIREYKPDAKIMVHGLTTRQMADVKLHPLMGGLNIIVVSTGNMGSLRSVAITLDRDGSLKWRWVLPVERGAPWRKIGDTGQERPMLR